MLLNQDRLRDAEEGALRLLKEHPGTGMVWKVLSVALVRQGKNALPALRKAAELMPRDAEAHANLGSALLAAGEWAEALASLEKAVELRPNDSESLIEAADAAQALGRAEEALRLYRRAVEIDPRSLRAHHNLGNALVALGRCADAVKSYRAALEVKAQDAVVLANLADALRQLGQLEEAIGYSERAIALDPALARAHNVLGVCLGGLGRRTRAVASLRRALALETRSVEVLTNLANVLRELGERGESLALNRQAVQIDPRRAESHSGLGNALFELRRLEEAAESHRRALALRPGYVPAQLGLAAVLRVQRRPEEAEALCRAALAAAPDEVEALALLAELRGDHGRFAEAEELLERVIRLDPQCVSAYCSIAAHRKMTSEDRTWLAAVEALLERPLPLGKSIALRYALGKYFDDVGQYDSAFHHYREANELTRRYGSRYEGDKLAARIERLIERFGAEFIGDLQATHRGELPLGAERQDDASVSDRPVFIIGMPRSGTSLAEQILASHPQVFGGGEVRFWDRAFASLEETNFEAQAVAGLVPRLASEYLARLGAAPASASRVVDKMPANFLYAGLIHAAFPRARLIHMQRDPTDTCLSIYFQNFFNMSPYGHDLEHLAHYYGEYLRIMAHWRAVLPSTVLLEVPYEALVADPERWTRRMLAFIGVPWDPRCLDFHRTERSVITASRWQVRQRIHASSVGRWRNYEKHLDALRPLRSLVPAITASAADAASGAGADSDAER
ncbi:MAG TPA: sulfotransferase [Steroidobacteraceae bacterium]|nr:sulfotransferase [Steroidobacteraceae bacterium]